MDAKLDCDVDVEGATDMMENGGIVDDGGR
jgi:hypothetical protein